MVTKFQVESPDKNRLESARLIRSRVGLVWEALHQNGEREAGPHLLDDDHDYRPATYADWLSPGDRDDIVRACRRELADEYGHLAYRSPNFRWRLRTSVPGEHATGSLEDRADGIELLTAEVRERPRDRDRGTAPGR